MLRNTCATFWLLAAGTAASLCLFAGHASAVELSRPDAHAPIGVMGDHIHHEGELMLSYRYMRMHMDGNRDGTSKESVSDVLSSFIATPTEMDMQMHMIGAMYAPKDWITLTAMFPVVVLEMDHVNRMGREFRTRSTGLGDISTTALIRLFDTEQHQMHVNAGISWPSGSFSRKDETPASGGDDALLPYPMQLGSGTVDLLPGVTYNGQAQILSWGAQARGTVRLGRNKENYRLGNRYALTAWSALKPSRWVSVGARAEWSQWFNIRGRDDRLGQLGPAGIRAEDFIPTADPSRRAGERLDIGPSVNFLMEEGPLKGLRFGFEVLFPAYQSLDGPQLETDWSLTSGVQYAF